MKTDQTFAIDFITLSRKGKKTLALLYARVTVNGERKEISLKEKIKSNDWDSAREMIRGNTIGVKKINHLIEDVRFRLKDKYRILSENQCSITADAIKEAYLGIHASQKSRHSLLELLKYHKKIEGDKLEPGTMKNYVATEEYCRRFIKHKYNLEDLPLEK
jgi:integrase/recombinase XerD